MSRLQDAARDARVLSDLAFRDGESRLRARVAGRLGLVAVACAAAAWWGPDPSGPRHGGTAAELAAALAVLVLAGPVAFLWSARPVFARLEALHRDVDVEVSRQEFEGRLRRAFEMAVDEPGAIEVARRGVEVVLPEGAAELLLADSSDAHLHRAMHRPAPDRQDGPDAGPDVGPDAAPDAGPGDRAADLGGCPVASPWACPAVVSGRTRVFPDAAALDACPQLTARPVPARAAACLPVTSMGRALGVLHVTVDGPDRLTPVTVERLRMLAGQAGHGIGTRRSFDRTQVQASTDPLTGLLNRRSLEDRAATALADVPRYAVVLVDLDKFKQLNDVHGHETGDRAIRAVGTVLKQVVRDRDLAGRYGGDEFVLVLPGADEAGATVVAERVREALASAPMGPGPALAASLGVASVEQGVPLADAIRLADHALLEAKRTGRNRVLSAAGVPAPRPAPDTATVG